MRRHYLLATLAALCMGAFMPTAKAQSSTTLSSLQSKNKQIDDAFIKGDPAPIHDMFSPSATITNPAGGLVSREELFAFIRSGTLKYTSTEKSEEKLAQFGDVAILTYLSNDTGTMDGHDISGKTRWTEVWAQKAGQWKIVAVQGTPVVARP